MIWPSDIQASDLVVALKLTENKRKHKKIKNRQIKVIQMKNEIAERQAAQKEDESMLKNPKLGKERRERCCRVEGAIEEPEIEEIKHKKGR